MLSKHNKKNSPNTAIKPGYLSLIVALSFIPITNDVIYANPIGGSITSGTGSITQSQLETTINQSSQNLSINWQSFDVNVNEKVNFIQPSTSSIALNRIVGNNGSVIQGQINANGQVFLVNPNGILFTPTATVNVGGLFASTLDISDQNFLNQNYIFNKVLGSDGAVINQGVINASLGGNVALVGQQVNNEGLINAKLGSVVLAAGKQSVLTFDQDGMIGVSITQSVLQDEIGVEEAVINSGEINASGGRVLLTATTSQDVFNQAVNSNGVDQATSVVVHEDGSFTLGLGADVINTGEISVSSDDDSAARIVLLGENVENRGNISADSDSGAAGEIELHSVDTTLVSGAGQLSATSSSEIGGVVKILGNKVGLIDNAVVNVSGLFDAGSVYFGGDRQGLNPLIPNAEFIYQGVETNIFADSTQSGNGGSIYAFASNTARIHGGLYARGGNESGNGGFIETSGLMGFEITSVPDASAVNGTGGLWLIDPFNISIVNNTACGGTCSALTGPTFSPVADSTLLDVQLIAAALDNNDVEINTGNSGSQNGDIIFDAVLDFDHGTNQNNRKLTLVAHNDIIFTNNAQIFDSDRSGGNSNRRLDLELEADSDGLNGGDIYLASTQFNAAAPADPYGINLWGGEFLIKNSNNVSHFIDTIPAIPIEYSAVINTGSGNFNVEDTINFDGSNITIDVGFGSVNFDGNNGVTGNVILGNISATDRFGSDLVITKATSISQASSTSISIARNTHLNVTGGSGTHNISLTETGNDFNNIEFYGTHVSIYDTTGIELEGGSTVTGMLQVTAEGNITDRTGSGGIYIDNTSDTTDTAIAIFESRVPGAPDTYGNITLDNWNNSFNNIKIVNAQDVTIYDRRYDLGFEANSSANSGGIRGNLRLTTRGQNNQLNSVVGGSIFDMSGIDVPGSMPTTQYTGEINVGGTTTLSVPDNRDITLDTANNTFDGAFTFNVTNFNSGDQIDDITLVDETALTLPSLDLSGNLNVTGERIVFGSTTLDGTLDATTTGIPTATPNGAGSITQTARIDLSGTSATSFMATGDITLENSSNDFKQVNIGNVSQAGGRNVSIRDIGQIQLNDIYTAGSLTITAGSWIALNGDISTDLSTSSGAGNVSLIGSSASGNSGRVVLNSNVTIDTDHATLADGEVRFDRTVDNNGTTTNRDLIISSGTGNVTFDEAIGGIISIRSLDVNSTTGSIVTLPSVTTRGNTGVDSIDITADTINLAGTNYLTNDGTSNAGNIVLTGDVVLSNTSINLVLTTDNTNSDGSVTIAGSINSNTTNFRSLTINSGTGAVDLSSASVGASRALSAIDLIGGIVELAAVTTNGNSSGTDVIDITGSTRIELNGNLVSNGNNTGGNILLTGNVQLNANTSITSDAGNTGSQGDVSITGNVNSDTTARTLTVNADDNAISVGGNIGNSSRLQDVDLLTDGSSGTSITVHRISTTDTTGTTNDSGVTLTAATVNLDGNISTDQIGAGGTESGFIDINGATRIQRNITIDTNDVTAANDGYIDFSGNINSQSGEYNALTLDAGTADIAVNGQIGISRQLDGFTVTSGNNTSVQNINTRNTGSNGQIDITSNTVNLNGLLSTTAANDAGYISVSGSTAINLNAAGATVSLSTDASGNDANITLNGNVQNATSKNLVLAAGTGDVSMTGTAGTGTVLQSLTITADDITLGTVDSIDAIDITGGDATYTNSTITLTGNLTTTGTASNIELKDAAVELQGNITLAAASNSSSQILIEGPVNADQNTNNRTLSVQAGSGNISFNSDIGQSQALQSLTTSANDSSTLTVGSLNTRSGGIDITSGTLDIGGTISTDDDVNAGEIQIDADTINILSDTSFDSNAAASDGLINITGSAALGISGASPYNLTFDSGTANLSVDHSISNVRDFTVSNSGTTILNGVVTDGNETEAQIQVTASNGLTLNGTYEARTTTSQSMDFNADSDGNQLGALVFGTNASFTNTSGPINFTGAGLTTNGTFSINAPGEQVSFNGTGNISLGSYSNGLTLNNTQLSNITSDSLSFTASNLLYVIEADLSGFSNSSLEADTVYFVQVPTSYPASSRFDSLNISNSNNVWLYTSIPSGSTLIDASGNVDISATDIIVRSSQTPRIQSAGDMQIAGNISTLNNNSGLELNAGGVLTLPSDSVTFTSGGTTMGNLSLTGDQVIMNNNDINVVNDFTVTQLSNDGNLDIGSNMTSTNGQVTINANDNTLTMSSTSNISAANGITLNTSAGRNILLSSLSNGTGTIDINSGGQIIDNNGASVNISTNGAVEMDATGGIGSINGINGVSTPPAPLDPLELNIDNNGTLTVTNNGSGNVVLSNSGSVTIEKISNINPGNDIVYTNTGGDVLVGNAQGGFIVDKVNSDSIIRLDISGGDVNGVQPDQSAHFTGNSLFANMNNTGHIGQPLASVKTDVVNVITVIQNDFNNNIEYVNGSSPIFNGDNAFKNLALQAIESVQSQQLIEVETLAEIDPAIFTDVRNYNHSDIALMMPADQRYDVSEDEEEKNKKQRQEEVINSIN